MADDTVRLLDRRYQRAAEEGDVLVVPGVAVGNGSPIRDAVDLVAVVPPREHPGVLGGVVADPPVGLPEVVDHHWFAVRAPAQDHDRGVGEIVGHGPAVPPEVEGVDEEEEQDDEGGALAYEEVLPVHLPQVLHKGKFAGQLATPLSALLGSLASVFAFALALRHIDLLIILRDRELRQTPREHHLIRDPGDDAGRGAEDEHEPDHLARKVA
mmetsp:Transcript_21539/g.51093  ORF Transcript_21539/g.51093 Transcript_21539/m.51093 type:complete len:212 (-) Transcript_21539:764-1399(-)